MKTIQELLGAVPRRALELLQQKDMLAREVISACCLIVEMRPESPRSIQFTLEDKKSLELQFLDQFCQDDRSIKWPNVINHGGVDSEPPVRYVDGTSELCEAIVHEFAARRATLDYVQTTLHPELALRIYVERMTPYVRRVLDASPELATLRSKVAAAEQMAEALDGCLSPLQDAQNQLRHIKAAQSFIAARAALSIWKGGAK